MTTDAFESKLLIRTVTETSFTTRLNIAVQWIESGKETTREFDNLFETSDADVIVAAVYKKAKTRKKLAANVRQYLNAPETSGDRVLQLIELPFAELKRQSIELRVEEWKRFYGPNTTVVYGQLTKSSVPRNALKNAVPSAEDKAYLAALTTGELAAQETFQRDRIKYGLDRNGSRLRLKFIQQEQKRRKAEAATRLTDDEWIAQSRYHVSQGLKSAELPSGQRVILKQEATASTFRTQSREFLLYARGRN